MHKKVLFFLIIFCVSKASAQNNSVDVLKYEIELNVNDSNDIIIVKETIHFDWLDAANSCVFDLANVNAEGKGMVLTSVEMDGMPVLYEHKNNQLTIGKMDLIINKDLELKLNFSGIPINGLIIGKNKYGNRTFFGDNWPNRAHNWFACNDHPLDKATVNFKVDAPSQYQVIANGALKAKDILKNERVLYEYQSDVPLPTKVMVVGIADFASKELGKFSNVSLSSWVYPENEANGFLDFEFAPRILSFFTTWIGPYEYEKLANVQSTTQFGGMENAGCIFYDENAINGEQTCEMLMAHEIAHQWFGNSVSEKSWTDVWLSEGFATYFTNLFIESTYGPEKFKKQLELDRQKIIKFSRVYYEPIIDTGYADLMDLLNPNSYQKGSWVLHMLRRTIGDELFKKGMDSFYEKFRLSNASTADFIKEMETVSNVDLSTFFNQWLYTAGHPKLKLNTKSKKKSFKIDIEQTQNSLVFEFPIVIELTFKNGEKKTETMMVNSQKSTFSFVTTQKVISWKLDPNVDLLVEIQL